MHKPAVHLCRRESDPTVSTGNSSSPWAIRRKRPYRSYSCTDIEKGASGVQIRAAIFRANRGLFSFLNQQRNSTSLLLPLSTAPGGEKACIQAALHPPQ